MKSERFLNESDYLKQEAIELILPSISGQSRYSVDNARLGWASKIHYDCAQRQARAMTARITQHTCFQYLFAQ